MHNIHALLTLEFFKIGLFTFGGGYASLPFLYEIVEKYAWFTNEQLTQLIAISGLILTETFYGEIRDVLGLQGKKIAEVGGSMVLPEYRGQNLMLKINKMLVELAREQGYEHLVATVHPDNVASRTSAETLGFVKKDCIMRKGRFLRNVYQMDL